MTNRERKRHAAVTCWLTTAEKGFALIAEMLEMVAAGEWVLTMERAEAALKPVRDLEAQARQLRAMMTTNIGGSVQ